MDKNWAAGIAAALIIAILGWGGSTLVDLSTKVAALEATQEQLIKTIDRTLDALAEQ